MGKEITTSDVLAGDPHASLAHLNDKDMKILARLTLFSSFPGTAVTFFMLSRHNRDVSYVGHRGNLRK